MTSLNDLLRLPAPLVLASTSPRRRQLLSQVGFEFSVVKPQVDEDVVPAEPPYDRYVQTLASLKAADVLQRIPDDVVVVGSDTTVVLGTVVLNKPKDAADAVQMLTQLSGNTHTVYTGIAIHARVRGTTHVIEATSATQVTFRKLRADEIDSYVASGSPLDKAGSYGIQEDVGALFVSSINGCYFTVVGLPLELLYRKLQSMVEYVEKQ
ncbi:MAG: septum formation inhibitor Maf [Bradyrhizobiaceae bacterium]|nr:septum formation inhibitor Maf [Bradyrhizobiaceae bacterium]